jgi:penicillin-insensitive murein endopeptidase
MPRPALLTAAVAAACCAVLAGCEWPGLQSETRIDAPDRPAAAERIAWRRSVAIGSPSAGRLERGVRLPAEGEHFFTWDPVQRRRPNRAWRRYGTDRLVRLVLGVAREHRRANPGAPRMAVGDLSRPRGGDFGPQFGYIGHASHQNGLDVDVYYPRADGREKAPRDASQIDRGLSQDLVDRFVEAGALTVFVGPNTGLRGPAGIVVALANHDNHLHVRIR